METILQQQNTHTIQHQYKTGSPVTSTTHPLHSKYLIKEEIGHGAQGRIFRAIRLSDNVTVAIKQLNISSIKTWKEYDLFHREASLLKTVNISGVAKFYDDINCYDDDPPCSYIVQEYINGTSLQKMLNGGHRFKTDDIYDILTQTLIILNQLHHHNPPIIHRDIKPSNLMLTLNKHGNYQVTIIDFGAVANPQVQGGGSTIAGTFGYMPPEQLTGKPVPASDIYALAATAVQLFSGKSPADLPQKDFRLIFEPELQDKPHDLVVLLGLMLDPNVDQRLSDIPHIIEQLQNIKSGVSLTLEPLKTKVQKKYTSNYNKKLSMISDIGQNNNIELWKELPDNIPRQIPDYYNNIIKKYTNAVKIFINKRFDNNIIENKISKVGELIDKLGYLCQYIADKLSDCRDFIEKVSSVIFKLFLISGALTIFEIILQGVLPPSEIFFFISMALLIIPFIPIAIIIFTVFIMLLLILFYLLIRLIQVLILFYKTGLYIPIAINMLTIDKNRFGITAEDLLPQMRTILQKGRKTIAKIDKIEYLHQENPEIIYAPLPPNMDFRTQQITARFLCDKPLFRITYRFNPPDDKRMEDIVHSFITQSEPENHYNLGDPLPILYYIEDKYLYDVVSSMPFPLSDLDLSEPMEGMIVDSSVGHTTTISH